MPTMYYVGPDVHKRKFNCFVKASSDATCCYGISAHNIPQLTEKG
jgi:hypothetical protein